MKFTIILVVIILQVNLQINCGNGYKTSNALLNQHLEELLQAALGQRLQNNFQACAGNCLLIKKYQSIFPLKNFKLQDDLNLMNMKWILINDKYIEIFSSESQQELPDDLDLTKKNDDIKLPTSSQFLNQFSLTSLDTPCTGLSTLCTVKQWTYQMSKDKDKKLFEKINGNFNSNLVDNQCIIISNKYLDRQKVICSKSLFNIYKLQSTLSYIIMYSPKTMNGRIWLLNQSLDKLQQVNLLLNGQNIVNSNVLAGELEEFRSMGNFKQYFSEYAGNLGFPAASAIIGNPFKTKEKIDPRRCFKIEYWSDEQLKSIFYQHYCVFSDLNGLQPINIARAMILVKVWIRKINSQSVHFDFLDFQEKLKKGEPLCNIDIQKIAFKIQGSILNLALQCDQLGSNGILNKKQVCEELNLEFLKRLLQQVCKKNNECISRVIQFIAADKIKTIPNMDPGFPIPLSVSYINPYIGLAFRYAVYDGLKCDDFEQNNCDMKDPNDPIIYKKSQTLIEKMGFGSDVKPGCPYKLTASILPTKYEVQVAINTFRAVMGIKTVETLKNHTLCDSDHGVDWAWYYTTFFPQYSDPYIEFLQFTKNFAQNNDQCTFYKDWLKLRHNEKPPTNKP